MSRKLQVCHLFYAAAILSVLFSLLQLLAGPAVAFIPPMPAAPDSDTGPTPAPTTPDALNSSWRCDPRGGPSCFAKLHSVAMASGDEGWAVGEQGTILHYSRGMWQTANGPTTRDLESVAMGSVNEAWAVGERGTILHYVEGVWQALESPTSEWLYDVAVVSANEGWAVGGDGTILHYTGGTWQIVDSPTSEWLHSIAMVSANEGWAVGSHGTIMHYSGGTWQAVESPTTADIQSVVMVSNDEGWAVGGGGIILHYSGGTWQSVASPTNRWLMSIAMASTQEGWAVGWDGLVLHYSGATWQAVGDPTASDLYAVAMVSANEGWAVGAAGTILCYHEGTWQTIAGPPTNLWLNTVTTVSADEAWAVGDSGTILHYSDGTWQTVPSPTCSTLDSATMVSPDEGWAVGSGGTILHYAEGTWQEVSSPTTNFLHSLAMVSANEGWVMGDYGTILRLSDGAWQPVNSPTTRDLYSVDMVSADEGWAVGLGRVLHYSGDAWLPDDSSISTAWLLASVDMMSVSEGWAVGINMNPIPFRDVALRYNGGTWQTVATPTDPPLSSVAMVSANDGWAVGWDGAILHYSGGAWQAVESPTTADIESVDVVSEDEGWAVGEGGIILRYMASVPPNDLIDAALDITNLPFDAIQADTDGATVAGDDPVFSCDNFSGQGYHTVWYRYTPSTSGTLTVDTLGSTYDTVLALWTGRPGALEIEACNDNSQETMQTSRVEIPVLEDATYYIEVASASSEDQGFLSLHVTCTVDAAAVQAVANHWRQSIPRYDFDEDGVVTVVDIMRVSAHWGEHCSGAPAFVLKSPAFSRCDTIPRRYTCRGDDISPALLWHGAPVGTRSFALIMDDPDAPGGTFTHWVLFDIPSNLDALPEGLQPGDIGTSGTNSFFQLGYGGPCPPQGSGYHRYVFTLYALDTDTLNLQPGASRSEVEQAIQGHIIARVQLMGRYRRR